MNQAVLLKKLPHFVALVRLDRPIGIFLLLWPVLWSLWFAARGIPRLDVLIIFVLGTVLTRSAGCAINDYADRHVDGHVTRTRNRPLASGALTPGDALLAAGVLMLAAFCLVLLTNALTILLAVGALALAAVYPFAKRYTHWPQVVLGAAFAWAVPMAFAAQRDTVTAGAWILFLAVVLWAMAYDTLYAMADREDDRRIGVKSTAILFGRADLAIVGILHAIVLLLLVTLGLLDGRGILYFSALAIAAGLAVRQVYMARHRDPAACIRAFLSNNLSGLVIFTGIVLDFALEGDNSVTIAVEPQLGVALLTALS